MNIQIMDNNYFLDIQLDSTILSVSKAAIRCVEVIKPGMLRIDIANDPLRQLQITSADVTIPAGLRNGEELRQVIVNMVNNTSQDPAIGQIAAELNGISSRLKDIYATVDQTLHIIDGTGDTYRKPLRVDQGTANIVYKGFAQSVASLNSWPVWAIQRIRTERGIITTAWANGNKNLENVWDDRTSLNYLPD